MKNKNHKIRNFLKEFVALMFVIAMVLAMASPIAFADTADSTLPPTADSTLPPTADTKLTDIPTSAATPTDPTKPVILPGEGKENIIFIPLNTGAYSDFPHLTQTSPTGMLAEFVNGLTRNLKYLLGAVAVFFIAVSAIKLIIMGNSEESVTKQKQAIIYGIIGLAVVGFADDFARVLSVACAPGELICARGGFLKDPGNIIKQAGLFQQSTRIFIVFIKYIIGSIAVVMFVRNGIRMIGLAGNEESLGIDKKNLTYTSIGLVAIIIATTLVDKVLYVLDPAKYSAITGAQPAVNAAAGLSELTGITNLVVLFTAPLAILMLIIGAVMYAASAGNEETMNKAKRIITLAIIGMILIYGAFAIVSTVISRQFIP